MMREIKEMPLTLFGKEHEPAFALLRSEEKPVGKDPLIALNALVDWSIFAKELHQFKKSLNKQATGRKPFDPLLMFKILILQSLYNLSDEMMEYMIQDRISFMRFLGLGGNGRIPDARTIWRFRNELSQSDLSERLFKCFNDYLDQLGFKAQQGQIIDASIVEVPRQRITRAEKETLAEGKTPEDWSSSKSSHKDTDATWTQKRKKNYYGYKNHIKIDSASKIIRKYSVTTASTHDSQVFDEILDAPTEGNNKVFADSAYKSQAHEELLKRKGLEGCIIHKARRNTPLTETEKAQNKEWSKTRTRVEHIFGMQLKKAGTLIVRAVKYTRVRGIIGLRNLSYNMTRFVWLMTSKGSTVSEG